MSAKIIPLPSVQRRVFVTERAARVVALPERTVEKLLAHQLDVQRQTMLRRGIPADVEGECVALATAIRAKLSRLTWGGVA